MTFLVRWISETYTLDRRQCATVSAVVSIALATAAEGELRLAAIQKLVLVVILLFSFLIRSLFSFLV